MLVAKKKEKKKEATFNSWRVSSRINTKAVPPRNLGNSDSWLCHTVHRLPLGCPGSDPHPSCINGRCSRLLVSGAMVLQGHGGHRETVVLSKGTPSKARHVQVVTTWMCDLYAPAFASASRLLQSQILRMLLQKSFGWDCELRYPVGMYVCIKYINAKRPRIYIYVHVKDPHPK